MQEISALETVKIDLNAQQNTLLMDSALAYSRKQLLFLRLWHV